MSTWIKLHDNFWENPKVLAAGEDAALLYIQGLSYCSRNLTDGAIPTPALRNLTSKREAKTLARILVREGLWIETATGWTVHDYLKVQRSRAQVEDEREKARERQAKRRTSRTSHAVTSGEVTAAVRVPDTETEPETDTHPLTPALTLVEAPATQAQDDELKIDPAQTEMVRTLKRQLHPVAPSPGGQAQERGGRDELGSPIVASNESGEAS